MVESMKITLKVRTIMNADKIPDIIIGRLPIYLRALEHMANSGLQTTSSQELGEQLGISAAQIRKDISQFGEFGKQGTGYHISFLIEKLRAIMKIDTIWDIAVVGAGDVGHALANYPGFVNRGFRIAMVFDNDPAKVGQPIGQFVIQSATELVDSIQAANIKVAMLAVPAATAQEVTDKLVQAGVKAILNYAPISLSVPETVRVQNTDPVTHLQRMTYYL